jgi:hypothetical protein
MTSEWQQGQHLALIGATGTGKTYLARRLLTLRLHSMMLVTKPDAVNWDSFGWRTVHRAREIDPAKGFKWRLFPKWERAGLEFVEACQMAWSDGKWCVYFDEGYHIKEVGAEATMVKLLTQGRSKLITVVVGMQRPSWVTKFALSEPTHVFSFRLNLGMDLNKIREECGREMEDAIRGLNRYQFAYLHQETREIQIGRESDVLSLLGANNVSGIR